MSTPRLLIVEADPFLMDTARRILGRWCDLVLAPSRDAALDVLAHEAHLDAIIVSDELCGGGGELLQWTSLTRPQARLLITSGRRIDRVREILDAAAALGIIDRHAEESVTA